MGDLKSKPLIVAKGLIFLLIIIAGSALVLMDRPSLRNAGLLLLIMWASARFYYFLFYALERYVDPSLRYAGVLALLQEIRRRLGCHRSP